MSGRILLLRSGSAGSDDPLPGDVTVLHTHALAPRPEGIAEALAFDARDATLVVSSKETIRLLLPLFRAPFARMVAVGEGTAALLRRVNTGGAGDLHRKANTDGTEDSLRKKKNEEGTGDSLRKADPGSAGAGRLATESTYGGEAATSVVVPEVPGAAGVIDLLRKSSAAVGVRVLWPHGSDAAPEPLEEVRALGVALVAPVVYEKRALSPSELNPSILADFHAGRFAAVAVGSTAGLDVLLAALRAQRQPPPNVRWGVLGPETANALAARGLPAPSIPAHARLFDLLGLLRKEIR